MSRESATPLMQQYREIKSRHQDAILFFRMGDFYEMFYDDAETASRVLGLTLTSRNNGGAAEVPLAGVPVKALDEYLRRLVRQGFRVAICEQVEDPRLARGIVRREVVETVTPGAVFSDDLLDSGRNNYLVAIRPDAEVTGIAAADLSTGELRLMLVDAPSLEATLARLAPTEVLIPRDASATFAVRSRGDENALVSERDAWEFDDSLAAEELARQFGVASLAGLGVRAGDAPAVGAGGALLRYLRDLQPAGLPHLARPVVERPGRVMPLDEMTRRNLELVESLRGGDASGTLLGVLDRTMTPMGARLLRDWILTPLTELALIDSRLDAVEAIVADALAREALREVLDGVRDVERLGSKAATARANPREMAALGASLARLPRLEACARRFGAAGALARILDEWDAAADLAADIAAALVDHPPVALGDEPAIRPGVDAELDELRALRDGGKEAIARIQASERERTGITSLKVGFNRVFGYYIEITNANRHLVPQDYQRRQTLAGAERYITPELKEYEERILTSVERIEGCERALFDALRGRVGAEVARLQRIAGAVAHLDVLATLAEVAAREGYTRPELHDGYELEILAGRHPVVERMMPREKFIPNDVQLTGDARMIILTGPNMAGKSTILRQVGLIVLMAQMGGFVPAARARIGIADRVFTRVGASDNLVRGQSTFMVEMSETSAILHTATARSLVLLDEIGRGTSTYDGVSIAWAVSEHLHDKVGCRCVFATHYHELTRLADELVAVRNYNVAVREVGEEVIFLHRLEPGGADRSYGIEVGRIAGLPESVIRRARALLRLLEAGSLATATHRSEPDQLPLFIPTAHPVLDRLRELDVDQTTPLEALKVLDEVVRAVKGR